MYMGWPPWIYICPLEFATMHLPPLERNPEINSVCVCDLSPGARMCMTLDGCTQWTSLGCDLWSYQRFLPPSFPHQGKILTEGFQGLHGLSIIIIMLLRWGEQCSN